MKMITRDTDYAVRAVSYIASSKQDLVSAAELVSMLKIPKPFLRKILQALNRSGILESYKGKGGGFRLASPPQKILITDLMEIFQGPLRLNECTFKKRPCPNKDICILRKKIERIEKGAAKALRNIAISELM